MFACLCAWAITSVFTAWYQFEPDSRLNVSIWCWRSTKMSKHMFQAYFEHCRPQSAGNLGDGHSACDHSCSFYQPSSLTYGLPSSALVWCLHYKSVPSDIIALRGNALVAMVTLALHKLTSWRLALTELLWSVILKMSERSISYIVWTFVRKSFLFSYWLTLNQITSQRW